MRTYDEPSRFGSASLIAEQTSAFLNSVYGWMCFGLIVTAATAWFTASSPTLVRTILANGPLFWGLALYLDFMNLFLFLLRFTGNRRQQ